MSLSKNITVNARLSGMSRVMREGRQEAAPKRGPSLLEESFQRTQPSEPLHLAFNGKSVGAHLLTDPQHMSYPSTHEKIRVYSRSLEGEIALLDFQDLLPIEKDTQKSFVFRAEESRLYDQYDKTTALRNERLSQLDPVSQPRILPKDHSLRVDRMEVSVGLEPESDVYFEQLADIGAVEGFHIYGLAALGMSDGVERDMVAKKGHNFTISESHYNEVWLEDYGEPTIGGGRMVPAIIDQSKLGGNFVIDAQTKARTKRFEPLGLSSELPLQGGVNESYLQYVAMGQSLAQGQHSSQGLSYLEGGNILPGQRADGTPYLLVGADSQSITKSLLEVQSPGRSSDDAVLRAIASDTGMRPEQVTVIEQPGDFHIDMRMMPIGPGEFILQDSRQAASRQIEWMKDEGTLTNAAQEKLEAWGQRVAPYEDLCGRQLEQAGFKVHRVAGAFLDVASEETVDSVNFFNARHGTDNQGQRYSIFMGASSKQEAYFAQLLLDDLKAPIDRLYFTDPEVTASSLQLQGGLKCRTKSLGTILEPLTNEAAPKADPNSPVQAELF